MGLNPNGAPAGYYYKAGATAYLIDPRGTYSLPGASAPTTDPAGTYSAAGASVPTTDPAGTYSGPGASAPTTDPVGTYSAAGASAPTTDLAGTYSSRGASAPTTDPAGTYSAAGASSATTDPVGTYSAAGASAPTTDLAGTYSGRGASAPTTDPAGTYSVAGASTPTLAAAGTYIPVTGSISAAAQMQDPAGTYSAAGASAPTTDPAGTYSGPGASAATADPAGTYSAAGASAPTTDPAGTHSAVRASAPTTNRAGTYSGPGAGVATTDPAGTYSAAGASAPTTDRAGTYSAAGASAATTDPAGTYSAAGASAATTDPAGTYSGRGASAPTTDAAGTYSAAGATAATTDAAGTYSGPGASAATTDPAGTHSAARASAPTTDRAGTYSGPGASAATTDPAGTFSAAGASAPTLAAAGTYIPITGSTSTKSQIQDPAGTYSAAGASAPTQDPAGTYSGKGATAPTPADPGTYIATAGATSVAAETADAAGTYSGPGASAPTTDPAGTYTAAGASAPTQDPAGTYSSADASAPTPADPGTYIAVAGATSVAAETVDAAGTYSGPGASAPTTDPPGTYSGPGASAPTTDPAGTYTAAGASAPTQDPAGTYSSADASAPTPADPGTYIAVAGATSVAAETVDPAGTYSGAGASAPTQDPAGTYSGADAAAPTPADPGTYIAASGATSVAAETVDPAGTYSGAGASAPTLADAGTYIPVTGSTSAAAEIADPAGTYSPAGASAPTADPGGTYSAAGASAPTTDPAGTYSSPYALNRLFLEPDNTTPGTSVLSFNSATAVANYYGATSMQASLANQFFAGYGGTSATMLFTRYQPLGGERPHLLGANIGNLTLSQLQSINGSLSITFEGATDSGSVNLSGVASFSAAANAIQNALNSNLPVEAVTAGSSITPVSVSFSGFVWNDYLQVTSVSSGTVQLGAQISGPGVLSTSGEIINQLNGTPGGAGLYAFFGPAGNTSTETLTESYGVLTVGSVTSGAVAVGQEVAGTGVAPVTAIDGNLSGSGPGSTWVVNNAQTVVGENMTMNATPLGVALVSVVGATENSDYFKIQPNGSFGYDHNPSSLSYMSGTAAAALGLTQASGAVDSTPGGAEPSPAAFMNNLVQNENGQFGSFQMYGIVQQGPDIQDSMAAWAQSTGGLYTFSSQVPTTPPAGSSLPTTDPAGTYSLAGASAPAIDAAGTYSGPGASAPILADPGTYIPVTGATSTAAEVVDSAGTYSLAGASAPTLAQPGYYVPTPGASSETAVDPGYYQPYSGATTEFLAIAPVISGAATGQLGYSGQPDAPFAAVTITDPNVATSDTLTIQLTGGGALSDGAGFSALTSSAPGLYTLSGTAADVTSELDALVFVSDGSLATTAFALADGSTAGVSAVGASASVTVLPTGPVAVSTSTFLADQSTLDLIPGGFEISDTGADVAQNLDALSADPNVDSITLTDPNPPTLTITASQLTDDAPALGAITDAYQLAVTGVSAANAASVAQTGIGQGNVASVAVSDSAADVASNLDALQSLAAAGELSSIALTDPNPPTLTLTIAQALNDTTALGEITSPYFVAPADTAADIAAITSDQASALEAAEYTSIASTTGAVTMTFAEAQLLISDGLVVGGQLTATDTIAQMLALNAAQSANLTTNGYALTALDSAVDIQSLTTVQIAGLASLQTSTVMADDTSVALTAAQVGALEAANLAVLAPAGDQVTVSDTGANLQSLTAAQIDGSALIGVSGIYDVGGNLSFNADQTSAIAANGLIVSDVGDDTISETFQSGGVIVSEGGALLLSDNSDGATVDVGASSLSVTQGDETIGLNANSAESITATTRTNLAFAFTPGFGNDSIQGFAASGPGNDVLQFETSIFSYLTQGMSQSAEAAALLSNATSSGGNTIISDSSGDSLTLQSVSVATLTSNLGDLKFI